MSVYRGEQWRTSWQMIGWMRKISWSDKRIVMDSEVCCWLFRWLGISKGIQTIASPAVAVRAWTRRSILWSLVFPLPTLRLGVLQASCALFSNLPKPEGTGGEKAAYGKLCVASLPHVVSFSFIFIPSHFCNMLKVVLHITGPVISTSPKCLRL